MQLLLQFDFIFETFQAFCSWSEGVCCLDNIQKQLFILASLFYLYKIGSLWAQILLQFYAFLKLYMIFYILLVCACDLDIILT